MSHELPPTPQPSGLPFDHLVYVGFNSRVVALGRHTGQQVWDWKCRKGSGFPALLIDGDRLIVSIQGYTYCLDPATGDELWSNPLPGKGLGTPCLASVRGGSTAGQAYDLEQQQQRQHAAAAGAHGAGS
jgi:outer membrane protein assembly factor BamB